MSIIKKMLTVVLCTSVLCASASAEAQAATQERVEMLARIDCMGEKIAVTVLESPYTSGVHLVITGDVTVYRTADCEPLEKSDLQAGDTVRILYSRQVMMTHPPQIVAEDLRRKGPGLRISSTQIHGIGAVGNQGAEAVFFQHFHGPPGIGRVNGFGLAAPGIAGEEGKGIGPQGQGRFHRGGVTAGGGKMASKIWHSQHLRIFFIIAHFVKFFNFSGVPMIDSPLPSVIP